MFHIESCENRIKACINDITLKYLNIPNIVGIGLGRKTYNGYQTSIPSLTFLVSRKFSPHDLPIKYILPKTIGSIITDVIETGDFYLNNDNFYMHPNLLLDKVRPAYGGLSCSGKLSSGGCEGSIGYAVTGIENKDYIYLLSCAHVLDGGFDDISSIGSIVVQPASVYRNADTIGNLSKTILLKSKSERPENPSLEINEIDAAIAQVGKNNKQTRRNLLDVGIGPERKILDGTKVATVGLDVWKMGPYPKFTKSYGKINTTCTSMMAVNLCSSSKLKFVFSNQNIADIPYQQGDAGSIIVTEKKRMSGLIKDRYAVGMCIGGSVNRNYAVFTNIDIILEKLKIVFLK